MFSFIIKKSFCDGWDNLLSLVISNFIFMFIGLGTILLNYVVSQTGFVFTDILMYFLFVSVLSIIAFAYSELAVKIADFRSVRVTDFFKAIPKVIKDAVLFAVMCGMIFMISIIGIMYYFTQVKSVTGLFLSAMILWIDLFLILALQWFIPLHAMFHNNFRKCLKKCFIIFLDNFGFSLAVFLYNIVLSVISVFFLGFLPSCAGILIADCNALRILIYKYDYLEEHPELKTPAERKRIPWEELIYEDRETLGPRRLKSFIFPWKED